MTVPSVVNAWVGTGDAFTMAVSSVEVRSSSASAVRRDTTSARAAAIARVRRWLIRARWARANVMNTPLATTASQTEVSPGSAEMGPTVSPTAIPAVLATPAATNVAQRVLPLTVVATRTRPAIGKITA